MSLQELLTPAAKKPFVSPRASAMVSRVEGGKREAMASSVSRGDEEEKEKKKHKHKVVYDVDNSGSSSSSKERRGFGRSGSQKAVSMLDEEDEDEQEKADMEAMREMETGGAAVTTTMTRAPVAVASASAVRVSAGEGEEKMVLSAQQKRVLDWVLKGKNLFFTGSAGTGKSFLMREIISQLQEMYLGTTSMVYVCAPTGIAACNVGGTTVHSFAGIGLGLESGEKLAAKIKANKWVSARWRNARVLIIDEISMLDCALFEKLELIARLVRGSHKVFGGLQIVATGDFYQLPPVGLSNREEPEISENGQAKKKEIIKFCFQSPKWKEVMTHTFVLQHVYRQKDSSLVQYLNELREGVVSTEFEKVMKQKQAEYEAFRAESLSKPKTKEENQVAKFEPTVLFATNAKVDKLNADRLAELIKKIPKGNTSLGPQTMEYKSNDWTLTTFYISHLAQLLAQPTLTLCVGAQVILLKNLPNEGLVNGSRGVVVGFSVPIASASDMDNDLEGFGTNLRKDKIKNSTAGSAGGFSSRSTSNDLVSHRNQEELLPVVQFAPKKTKDGVEIPSPPIVLERCEWTIQEGDHKVASRVQVPLKLAWALSIHKSQGMTIDNLEVDLSNVFEYGQAYVALSRVTSLDGLRVRGFDKNRVMAHPDVHAFYSSLSQSE